MGAARRQHHAQQAAMRAANAEAQQQKALMEAQQQAFQQQFKLQKEAMLAQTKLMMEQVAPTALDSTIGSAGTGIQIGASKKKTVANLAKGASSLKIPLNVGGSSGSGLNIG